jgi:transcriptional regulator with XRE-family HTH domain
MSIGSNIRKLRLLNHMTQEELANVADERGEVDKPYFEELGLGYRALSGILRRGCKEIIDLQNNYHGAIEAKNLAKIGEKVAHDFLEEMFGDREVYTINDKDKERIKAFVRSIQDERERSREKDYYAQE